MRKAIELKSQVVSEIVEKLEKSSSAIVVDYKGLTVEEVCTQKGKLAGLEISFPTELDTYEVVDDNE